MTLQRGTKKNERNPHPFPTTGPIADGHSGPDDHPPHSTLHANAYSGFGFPLANSFIKALTRCNPLPPVSGTQQDAKMARFTRS